MKENRAKRITLLSSLVASNMAFTFILFGFSYLLLIILFTMFHYTPVVFTIYAIVLLITLIPIFFINRLLCRKAGISKNSIPIGISLAVIIAVVSMVGITNVILDRVTEFHTDKAQRIITSHLPDGVDYHVGGVVVYEYLQEDKAKLFDEEKTIYKMMFLSDNKINPNQIDYIINSLDIEGLLNEQTMLEFHQMNTAHSHFVDIVDGNVVDCEFTAIGRGQSYCDTLNNGKKSK